MLHEVLGRLGRLAVARPWRLYLAALLPAIALFAMVPTVPVDLSFTGVMNRENEEVARFFDTVRRYDLGGDLIVLLEGPGSRARRRGSTVPSAHSWCFLKCSGSTTMRRGNGWQPTHRGSSLATSSNSGSHWLHRVTRAARNHPRLCQST